MADKTPASGAEEKKSTADYYKLKTEAVKDLVTADAENAPEVSREELEQYGARKKKGIPLWLKVHFAKFWFPAAVCYFFFWGLGLYVQMLDLLVITGIVLGMVTDLLTNNVIRFMAETEGENDRWMMFPKKRYITFFQNILYAGVLLLLVFCTYTGINMALAAVLGQGTDSVFLGVEPILFGLFYVLWDAGLVGVRNALSARWRARQNKRV